MRARVHHAARRHRSRGRRPRARSRASGCAASASAPAAADDLEFQAAIGAGSSATLVCRPARRPGRCSRHPAQSASPSPAASATSSPRGSICRRAPCAPMRRSRTASPARRTSSPPATLPGSWPRSASPSCASTSPGSARRRASSPTPRSSNIEDLVRAADHLRERFAAPDALIGHSLGRGARRRQPRARGHGRGDDRGPSDVARVLHHFNAKLADIERDGVAEDARRPQLHDPQGFRRGCGRKALRSASPACARRCW